MKLAFLTQELAQGRADAIHEWLKANDPSYAESSSEGYTKRWAIPQEDGGLWFIHIKDRCHGALTADELAALLP